MARPASPPGPIDPGSRPPIIPFDPKRTNARDKTIASMVNEAFANPTTTATVDASERLTAAIWISKILEKIMPQEDSTQTDQIHIEQISLNEVPHKLKSTITRDPSLKCIVNKKKQTFSFPKGFVIKRRDGGLGKTLSQKLGETLTRKLESQFENLFPLPISFTLEPAPGGIKITLKFHPPKKVNIILAGLLQTAVKVIGNAYVIPYTDLPEFLDQLPDWKPETGPEPTS